jgi:hypothetical protein
MPLTHDKTGRTLKRSGDILAVPPKSTARPYRRANVAGQFTWQLIEMLESPAHRVLSLSARRLLNRIEIEHAHHGGRDNGRLPVTFDDFERFGIDRHAIAPAVRETGALGFIQVTERGRAGNAEYRTPNKFRLTYLPTISAGPTDDWRKIKTIEEAKAIAVAARTAIRGGRSTKGAAKSTKPVGINTSFSAGNPHRKAPRPMAETPTTGKVGKAPPLSIFRGGARANSDGEQASKPPTTTLSMGVLRT